MTAKCFGQSNTITAQWRDSSGHIVREQIVPSRKYPSEFKLNGKVGIIVYTVGEVIADPNYDEFFHDAQGKRYIYVIDSMRGYLDVRTGKKITAPIYKCAQHFNEDRAAVSLDGKKMGYIDTTGQMVNGFERKRDYSGFAI